MKMHDLKEKSIKNMEVYQQISMTLMQELEVFETNRVEEFKVNFHAYLKQALENQEKVLEIWEAYLPIANNIALTN
jgi:hypothetical protein